VAGPCERGNESSGSIKGGEFLDYLSDYELLKDLASWNYSIIYLKEYVGLLFP